MGSETLLQGHALDFEAGISARRGMSEIEFEKRGEPQCTGKKPKTPAGGGQSLRYTGPDESGPRETKAPLGVHSRRWTCSPSNGVEVHDVDESSQQANWNMSFGLLRSRSLAEWQSPTLSRLLVGTCFYVEPDRVAQGSAALPGFSLLGLRADRPTRDRSLCDRAAAAPPTIGRFASLGLLSRTRPITCMFVG